MASAILEKCKLGGQVGVAARQLAMWASVAEDSRHSAVKHLTMHWTLMGVGGRAGKNVFSFIVLGYVSLKLTLMIF